MGDGGACGVRGGGDGAPHQHGIRINFGCDDHQRQNENHGYGSHGGFIAPDCGKIGQAPANVFVMRLVSRSRTIAHNQTNTRALLSTLIEACASERRGLAISNEEQSDV